MPKKSASQTISSMRKKSASQTTLPLSSIMNSHKKNTSIIPTKDVSDPYIENNFYNYKINQ